jgi:ABC-type glycerol-3-phosphate transport system substrate-binding protein
VRKISALLIVSILFIGIFSSCGNKEKSDNGKAEVVFWHSFVASSIPALNDLIAEFEKTHPNIKIKAQYVPTGDALIQKLITAIQSQTAPDISWLHADFMEDLVAADAIYKMDHFIKGPNGIPQSDLDDIYPALITYSKWRDTLYSLPMEATNLALIYNKNMFRAAGLDPNHPPATWEELRDYSRKLTFDKDKDGKFEQVGMFLPIFPAAGPLSSWMVWQWYPYLWQAGGYDYALDQTHVLYDSEEGIKALKLWKDIFEELNLRNFTTDFDVAFVSNHLAMAMDGPWNLPRYKDLLKNIDWAVAPLPQGPAKKATIVGGEYLAIFKQSKHPDAAWEFIKWMIQPETQAMWSMKSGYLPIRHEALNVPEFKAYLDKNPNFKVFVEQMEYGQAQRQLDYGGLEVSRNIAEAIEKATIGRMDAAQSLKESARKSNEIIARERKERGL